MARLAPPTDPVTITFDGETIVAQRGEPIATALVAAGKLVVARSPKFHRPRGPSCLRAACDGCLARVDETPNVMTCMTPCAEGTAVVTQNRLGPREADLLRMTDWFFPDGMNHHELFAGVPGVQNVMQAFARRVAGLGKLPHAIEAGRKATRREVDVAIVGAGPSGMAIASLLARAGRSVEILDDQLEPGGGLLALGPSDASFDAIRASFTDLVTSQKITVHARTYAGGIYGRDLLTVGADGANIVDAKTLVLACGAHDGVLAFEGNDVPGVMSARAAGFFLRRGVVCGSKIVIAIAPGAGPFGRAYANAIAALPDEDRPRVELAVGEPTLVRGSSRVKKVTIGSKDYAADTLLVDAPRAPAYELAEQAGANVRHDARGYVVETDAGRIADRVYALGEMTGTPFDAEAITKDAARVAKTIV